MKNQSKTRGASLTNIVNWLDRQLAITSYSDRALNGLQIEGSGPVIKVALTVDASAESFRAAIAIKANLIIVHHGLFWGNQLPLVGPHYKKVKSLLDHGMALYAAHLPLDAHSKWGNNIMMAKQLNLKQIKPFGQYGESTIGFGGRLEKPITLNKLSQIMTSITKQSPRLLNFGLGKAKKIALVSGGGGSIFEQAFQQGYDTYITGEFLHQDVHLAKELGMNIIVGGHYATETLGVKALGQALAKQFPVSTQFLDLPTGF